MLGTVIFLVLTGVFVGQGMRLVAHHDTPAWMSGLSTVLPFVLVVCASCWRAGVCGVCGVCAVYNPPKDGADVYSLGASWWRRSVQCKCRHVLRVLRKAWSTTF